MYDHNRETIGRLFVTKDLSLTPSFISSFPHPGLLHSPLSTVRLSGRYCQKFQFEQVLIAHSSRFIINLTGNAFLIRDSFLFSFSLGQCSFRCRLQNNMCLLATGRFFVVGNQRLRACAKWIWCKQNNMQLWSFDHICVTDGSLWLKCKSVIFLNNFKIIRTRLNAESLWFKGVQAGCNYKNFKKKGKWENWKHTTSGLRPLKHLQCGNFTPLSGRKRRGNIPKTNKRAARAVRVERVR